MTNERFSYQSPIGRFVINEINGTYHLFFREELALRSADPNQLAFAVAHFCLCDPNWDSFIEQIKDVPQTLADWEKC